MLLTEERYRAEAETYLGHGANRVVTWEEAALCLPYLLEDLLKAAPRVATELSVQIEEVAEGPVESVACQTGNISRTGMLLRVREKYRLGTVLAFEMALPGASVPVCGHARVVRRTFVGKEPFPGVGVRFAGFDEANRQQLCSYLHRAAS